MSSSMKDFLDKFFDLCREYQEEISPQKMAEVLREYTDYMDEEYWLINSNMSKVKNSQKKT